MNRDIILATERALRSVKHPRLFVTERGYAAMFYHHLLLEFVASGLLPPSLECLELLEMEHQKSFRSHDVRVRPDIIFHIPVEVSGAERQQNNYAKWALKLGANEGEAREDFDKLNERFERGQYPLGFFINISGTKDFLELYEGAFADRLYGATVNLRGATPEVTLRSCRDALGGN